MYIPNNYCVRQLCGPVFGLGVYCPVCLVADRLAVFGLVILSLSRLSFCDIDLWSRQRQRASRSCVPLGQLCPEALMDADLDRYQ